MSDFPPHLDFEQLSEYVDAQRDGVGLDEAAAGHVGSCAECRLAVAALEDQIGRFADMFMGADATTPELVDSDAREAAVAAALRAFEQEAGRSPSLVTAGALAGALASDHPDVTALRSVPAGRVARRGEGQRQSWMTDRRHLRYLAIGVAAAAAVAIPLAIRHTRSGSDLTGEALGTRSTVSSSAPADVFAAGRDSIAASAATGSEELAGRATDSAPAAPFTPPPPTAQSTAQSNVAEAGATTIPSPRSSSASRVGGSVRGAGLADKTGAATVPARAAGSILRTEAPSTDAGVAAKVAQERAASPKKLAKKSVAPVSTPADAAAARQPTDGATQASASALAPSAAAALPSTGVAAASGSAGAAATPTPLGGRESAGFAGDLGVAGSAAELLDRFANIPAANGETTPVPNGTPCLEALRQAADGPLTKVVTGKVGSSAAVIASSASRVAVVDASSCELLASEPSKPARAS